VSIDESKTSLHYVHLLAPPLTGSHIGKSMYDITEIVLSALDSHWRAKLIGSTSDGAENIMGIYGHLLWLASAPTQKLSGQRTVL
jgi:hypothetical protein